VKLNEGKEAVAKSQQEHGHSHMPSVAKGQEAPVQCSMQRQDLIVEIKLNLGRRATDHKPIQSAFGLAADP
jgi:hypothetical protein